jgi:hypothetical protein
MQSEDGTYPALRTLSLALAEKPATYVFQTLQVRGLGGAHPNT